jgi:hypothetical protein
MHTNKDVRCNWMHLPYVSFVPLVWHAEVMH